jgi:uncharacterized membrane protein YkoI
MRSIFIASALILLALGTTQSANAETPSYRRDVPAKLASEAKISEAAAVSTAKSKVPNGKVVGLELEREKGVLLYSIDLKVAGADGVEEVEVDATSGKVIGTEHESAAKEKEEAAAEKKEADKHKADQHK